MFLRQLEYFSALARECHFGRAARTCCVSQPALSVAIKKLEDELGVELVRRADNRFADLTPEGRSLLVWAERALASIDGMASEASRLSGDLRGRLRLGVVPTALPAVAAITEPLLRRHPAIDLEVRSLSAVEIVHQLESHAIEAGVTYLDIQRLAGLVTSPLYDERYALITADPEPADSVAWADLDGVSLCLLTPEMQNRRIIDSHLADAGATPNTRVETDSVSALLSYVCAGWRSILSYGWLGLYGVPPGMRALALTDPDACYRIGLVRRETDLVLPVVQALVDEIEQIDLRDRMEALYG